MSLGKEASSDSIRALVISRNCLEMTAKMQFIELDAEAMPAENVRLPAFVQIEAASTTCHTI